MPDHSISRSRQSFVVWHNTLWPFTYTPACVKLRQLRGFWNSFLTLARVFYFVTKGQRLFSTQFSSSKSKSFLGVWGLVYKISDHFSCRIVFMNPIQKMLRSVSVYTKSYTEFRSIAYRIHTEPCKQNPNLIWNWIRYIGDPVSCKWGLTKCFAILELWFVIFSNLFTPVHLYYRPQIKWIHVFKRIFRSDISC